MSIGIHQSKFSTYGFKTTKKVNNRYWICIFNFTTYNNTVIDNLALDLHNHNLDKTIIRGSGMPKEEV